jgi:predicted nuclease with TOPRIM domain
MKIHTSITLDIELLQIAKARGINVSRICNDFLHQYLEMTDFDDDKQKEKEELNEKMIKAEAEAAKYREKLWKINTKEQKKQSKRVIYDPKEDMSHD